jgi:uncharacterized membrane protein
MPLPRIGHRFCGIGGCFGEIIRRRRQIRRAVIFPGTKPPGEAIERYLHPKAHQELPVIEQTSHRDDAPLATSKEREAAGAAADQLDLPQGDTLLARAVTINRGVSEVFACFRDFANLATFMENVERIEVIDSQRSHWVVKAPGGRTVEWDAVITGEAADSFIAWASAAGADVAHSGRVDFRDAGERGTVVTITLLYDPPAGAIGRLVARLFQREPGIQARRDLRRFKQLMETGEIATAARTRKQLAEEHA